MWWFLRKRGKGDEGLSLEDEIEAIAPAGDGVDATDETTDMSADDKGEAA